MCVRKPNKDAKIWDSWASDKDEEEDVLVTVKKMHVTDPKTKSKRKNKKGTTTATAASVSALIQEAFMKREYTPAELINRASKFQRKAKGSVPQS